MPESNGTGPQRHDDAYFFLMLMRRTALLWVQEIEQYLSFPSSLKTRQERNADRDRMKEAAKAMRSSR